ncbi:MAG: MBL fold metallo-hydrolase [Bacteroides sp.]|nr:MBL fold metallo-hydrolase [Bacteroides sp.]MCM1389498.1 MBL fold metallo-hydrolase [Bacteroides sp.]
MLQVKTFQFNMFGVNTYIIWDTESKDATIIDPGMHNASEQAMLDSFISDNNLKLSQLINTHMHVDHIFGDSYVKDKYGIKVMASSLDAFLGEKAAMQCRMFGLPYDTAAVEVDIDLKDGDTIEICDEKAHVLLVPGHSPGSIVIYLPGAGIAFTGDVIFQGSIGRTDLVAGNHQQLINGIREKLLSLPDSTILFPGHGAPTTVGDEKRSNPYI